MTETKKVYKMIEPYLTKELLFVVAFIIAAIVGIIIVKKYKAKGSNNAIHRQMITFDIAIPINVQMSDADKRRMIIALQKDLETKDHPVKEKELTEAEIIVQKALKRNQINNAKK